MKKLGGQIMKKFVGLRAKTYSFEDIANDEDKKAKGTQMYVKNENLNLKIIKNV